MKPRIMYIEGKEGSSREGRIGRVEFSKSGRTLYYKGLQFVSLKGKGIEGNYLEVKSGIEYWISGPKQNGGDRLFDAPTTFIDEDVREEYWTQIRKR
jgi:hypothetical protein